MNCIPDHTGDVIVTPSSITNIPDNKSKTGRVLCEGDFGKIKCLFPCRVALTKHKSYYLNIDRIDFDPVYFQVFYPGARRPNNDDNDNDNVENENDIIENTRRDPTHQVPENLKTCPRPVYHFSVPTGTLQADNNGGDGPIVMAIRNCENEFFTEQDIQKLKTPSAAAQFLYHLVPTENKYKTLSGQRLRVQCYGEQKWITLLKLEQKIYECLLSPSGSYDNTSISNPTHHNEDKNNSGRNRTRNTTRPVFQRRVKKRTKFNHNQHQSNTAAVNISTINTTTTLVDQTVVIGVTEDHSGHSGRCICNHNAKKKSTRKSLLAKTKTKKIKPKKPAKIHNPRKVSWRTLPLSDLLNRKCQICFEDMNKLNFPAPSRSTFKCYHDIYNIDLRTNIGVFRHSCLQLVTELGWVCPRFPQIHTMCDADFTTWIASCLADGKYPIQCPFDSCSYVIDCESITLILRRVDPKITLPHDPHNLLQLYQHKREEVYFEEKTKVQPYLNFFKCPRCHSWGKWDRSKNGGVPQFICTCSAECGYEYCTGCGGNDINIDHHQQCRRKYHFPYISDSDLGNSIMEKLYNAALQSSTMKTLGKDNNVNNLKVTNNNTNTSDDCGGGDDDDNNNIDPVDEYTMANLTEEENLHFISLIERAYEHGQSVQCPKCKQRYSKDDNTCTHINKCLGCESIWCYSCGRLAPKNRQEYHSVPRDMVIPQCLPNYDVHNNHAPSQKHQQQSQIFGSIAMFIHNDHQLYGVNRQQWQRQNATSDTHCPQYLEWLNMNLDMFHTHRTVIEIRKLLPFCTLNQMLLAIKHYQKIYVRADKDYLYVFLEQHKNDILNVSRTSSTSDDYEDYDLDS